MTFTLELLERLLVRGRDHVEWRHDVDYDPACALQMAELEYRIGIRSTFYVRARAAEYNAFSPDVTDILDEIVFEYGHELGVHVDLRLPRHEHVSDATMAYACADDLALFRAAALPFVFGYRASFHAPPTSVLWRNISGFESAHAPKWRGRNLSDSRGVWKESPEDAIARGVPIQACLHPEWWFWPQEKADEWRKIEAAKP